MREEEEKDKEVAESKGRCSEKQWKGREVKMDE